MENPDLINPTILLAVAAAEEGVKAARAVIQSRQLACSHPKVLHAAGEENIFGRLHSRRLCLVCRMEEESASAWYDQFDVLTTEFVKPVGLDELVMHRLGIRCDLC